MVANKLYTNLLEKQKKGKRNVCACIVQVHLSCQSHVELTNWGDEHNRLSGHGLFIELKKSK